MKYILIIFLFSFYYLKAEEYGCTLGVPGPVYDSYGFVLGTNISYLSHEFENLSTNSNYGFNLGFQYDYKLGDGIHSNSSIIFKILNLNNSVDYDFNNPLTSISERNNYIQFSTNYLFKFINYSMNSVYIQLGPYVNFNFEDKDFVNNSIFETNSFNKIEVGGNIGIGLNLEFDKLLIGIEYNRLYAFTDKYSYKDNSMRNKSHFINFIFTPKKLF